MAIITTKRRQMGEKPILLTEFAAAAEKPTFPPGHNARGDVPKGVKKAAG
ncbi:hypothetical protein [Propionivibrio sp.]